MHYWEMPETTELERAKKELAECNYGFGVLIQAMKLFVFTVKAICMLQTRWLITQVRCMWVLIPLLVRMQLFCLERKLEKAVLFQHIV